MKHEITKINSNRLENELVLYTMEKCHQTNCYGYEVAIFNSIAISMSENEKFVENGYILSAHGMQVDLLKSIELGDKIKVDLEKMCFEIEKDLLVSTNFIIEKYEKLYDDLIKTSKEKMILYDIFVYEKYNVLFLNSLDSIKRVLKENELENNDKIVQCKNDLKVNFNYLKVILKNENILQMRAIWHRPDEYDVESVKLFVNKLKDLKFNLLFVEAFYSGRVCYKSKIIETNPSFIDKKYDGFEDDYLKCLIHFCKLANIEVHTWNHSLNAGIESIPISDTINKNWLLENYQGNIIHNTCYGGNYYLDPSNHEVVDFIGDLFSEQVENYDIKGLQYDYVRYFENNYHDINNIIDSGYGTFSESTFKKRYQLNHLLDVKKAIVLDTNIKKMFFEFRQNNVTNLVKIVSKRLKKINQNIILSGSVVGDIEDAKNIYMQNWLEWIENKYIDMLNPMIYTGNSEHVKKISQKILDSIKTNAFLVSGIAPIYYHYPLIENQFQIDAINSTNCSGYSLFATQNVLNNLEVENTLKFTSNRNNPISIFDDLSLICKKYVSYLINKYIDIVDLYQIKNDDLCVIIKNLKNFIDYKSIDLIVDKIKNIQENKLKEFILKDLFYLKHVVDVRKNLSNYNKRIED